jgi:hypothetical protein
VSYDYDTEREKLFTEPGQRLFLKFRDNANRLLASAGAFRMDRAMAGLTGDSWTMLACADRMIELGEIVEVSPPNSAGQYRIFTYRQ